jgi:hypothetical protein
MKKLAPLCLGIVVGLYAVAEFYIPDWRVRWLTQELQSWAAILSAFAYVLGGVNLIQVNYPKIRRRERDWGYKVVMVVAAAVMGLAGLKWHKLASGGPSGGISYATPMASQAIAAGGPAGKARVVIDAPDDVMVKVGAAAAAPARDGAGARYQVDVDPGHVPVRVYRRIGGYDEYTADLDAKPGQVVTITADPAMLWGTQGRVYTWLYEHVFSPCNQTMFALLAFFVVSAAFRAFRMRNLEATLLLGSALIVLLACAPIGGAISPALLDVRDWNLAIPNNGGRRAIMMGAAIGAIATSLRIVLGLERSHLGAD